MIRIFLPFLLGGVPEYKHDKSEIAILRKTPPDALKVPRGTYISRVDGTRMRFLFVCHFALQVLLLRGVRKRRGKEVDRSVRKGSYARVSSGSGRV